VNNVIKLALLPVAAAVLAACSRTQASAGAAAAPLSSKISLTPGAAAWAPGRSSTGGAGGGGAGSSGSGEFRVQAASDRQASSGA